MRNSKGTDPSLLMWKIRRVEETGSTNADLAAMAGGAGEGTVLVARSQSAGRGRQGRQWVSQPGAGLYFSVLLKPQVPPERAATLPLVVGVAVARALDGFLGHHVVSIKWPNDILAQGRKLCGILCEMCADTAGLRHVVAGIGINVNLDVASLPGDVAQTATSMKALAGHVFVLDEVLHAVLLSLEEVYRKWLARGVAAIRDDLAARDWLYGKRVEMRLLGEPTAGIAAGISECGALLLKRDDGSLEEVFSGEAHIVSAVQTP